MKMKILTVGITLLLCSNPALRAQFTENFNDGNITANPPWLGNGADWTVNTAFQLQSNSSIANNSFYLSTASSLALVAQWEFYCKMGFNPSSANYIDVYLTAANADLTLTNNSGYFVRIGNTDDEISLYRKDANGTSTKIIDGLNGILNNSSNVMKIKVTRDASSQWSLLRDLSGTGNNYSLEGTVTDATFNSSAYFGILVKQSTASFFQQHFIDDIEVKTYVPDITPPQIQTITVTAANSIDVLFSEAVDAVSSQQAANYTVSNLLGMPSAALRDATNTSLVHLVFTNNFPGATSCLLTVNGVKDIAGNALQHGTASFVYYLPGQYDIVIDELMADPSPVVGLPNYEYVELKNTTAFPINLQGWKLADLNSVSAALPSYVLQPDSFLLLCSSSAQPALAAFGNAIAINGFPSLDNDADQLSLLNAAGKTIHAIHYDISWYQNELKKEGGWSLEMMDTKNPCTGSANWKASTNAAGGTPGKLNSVAGINSDQAGPALLRAFATDSLHITILFDESLDSALAAIPAHYTISDGIAAPQSVTAIAPLFEQVQLKLNTPLLADKIYTVTAAAVADCAGNAISNQNKVNLGLAKPADSMDIVINEILFNPLPGGVDFVELYNRSKKIINLKQLSIANRDATGVISNIKQISATDYLLFPGEYMVITEDPSIVKAQYLTQNPGAFLKLNGMPSFNDDKGDVIILNAQGNIVDELKYDEHWHFKLINNNEGISLERIDYNAATQNAGNWHSAATSAGYATPAYKNSQYRLDAAPAGDITITPEVFSPDNDGIDDFLTIDYHFPEPGYVANISLFDATGHLLRYLQQNALCGTKGNFRWDGLGANNQKLPVGMYIVYSEVFNLAGKLKKFKQLVVLARK